MNQSALAFEKSQIRFSSRRIILVWYLPELCVSPIKDSHGYLARSRNIGFVQLCELSIVANNKNIPSNGSRKEFLRSHDRAGFKAAQYVSERKHLVGMFKYCLFREKSNALAYDWSYPSEFWIRK